MCVCKCVFVCVCACVCVALCGVVWWGGVWCGVVLCAVSVSLRLRCTPVNRGSPGGGRRLVLRKCTLKWGEGEKGLPPTLGSVFGELCNRMGAGVLRAGKNRVGPKSPPELKENQCFLQCLAAICHVPVGTCASREVRSEAST